jgi:hypothetical protein
MALLYVLLALTCAAARRHDAQKPLEQWHEVTSLRVKHVGTRMRQRGLGVVRGHPEVHDAIELSFEAGGRTFDVRMQHFDAFSATAKIRINKNHETATHEPPHVPSYVGNQGRARVTLLRDGMVTGLFKQDNGETLVLDPAHQHSLKGRASHEIPRDMHVLHRHLEEQKDGAFDHDGNDGPALLWPDEFPEKFVGRNTTVTAGAGDTPGITAIRTDRQPSDNHAAEVYGHKAHRRLHELSDAEHRDHHRAHHNTMAARGGR